MALRESTHQAEDDLFCQELVNLIDMHHELLALVTKIDWAALEARFGSLYAAGVGHPGHSIRLMVDLELLKYRATKATSGSLPLGSRTTTGNTSAASSISATIYPLIPFR
jgi:hypothetical protein